MASVVLMTLDHRTAVLQPLRETLALIAYPLQALADVPSTAGRWSARQLASRASMIERIEQLQQERLQLRARMLTFESLKHENARLRELLSSARHFDEDRTLIAGLLAVDMDPFRQNVTLDRGASQGIYRGQPVLDAYGVMGQVTDVTPLSATAMLISDPGHAIPVQIDRSGLRTLAVGTGDPGRLLLPYLPAETDVMTGDRLSTSGLGGRFPANYPVADITEVKRPPGESFAHVSARPLARLDRSREVLLLWWEQKPAPLEQGPTGAADIGSVTAQAPTSKPPDRSE